MLAAQLAGESGDAGRWVAGASRRLPVLAAGVAVPSASCRADLEGEILPGAALYLELREHVDPDLALSLTGACLAEDAQQAARWLHRLDRIPRLFPVFRLLTMREMRQKYVPPAWQARVLEDTPQRVRFDITRCYYLDTLTALGIPELTVHYCHNDDLLWADLRQIEFRRSGTLGRGCDRCDFCYDRRHGM